ncbi:hypothetical protein E2C01_079977 [Portunus trituberculatus]|uniref:Uncharacterized protein n=1 Tax=Portunus trituberculatus TaxID=210409 RepID=A0A5B7IS68_PORTR|nr:hypothetical protein [Portunus trituberculatus]
MSQKPTKQTLGLKENVARSEDKGRREERLKEHNSFLNNLYKNKRIVFCCSASVRLPGRMAVEEAVKSTFL